jgi:hypothetical protein
MNDFKGLVQRKFSLGQETMRIPSVREDTQKSSSRGKEMIGKGCSYSRPQSGNIYYSSKYLGVTKGQIGILSKRVLMPCLSAYETCKDIPLSVINSALKRTRLPSGMIKEFIPNLNGESKEDEGDNVSKDSVTRSPYPEEVDEFVIHTYARPNGLTSIRKPTKPFNLPTPIKIAKKRKGITGWKLSRPSTATKSRSKSSIPFKPAPKPQNPKPSVSKVPLSGFHNEIYLKYLHDKQKLT